MKRFSLAVSMAILISCFAQTIACGDALRAVNTLPNVSPGMLTADFWVDNTQAAADIILTQAEINEFNQKTRFYLPDAITDLSAYPDSIPGDKIRALVQKYRFPEGGKFSDGLLLNEQYWNAIREEINLQGIGSEIKNVEFAFTLRRTNLRSFPTSDFVASHPREKDLDLFQETALEGAEPVIILHKSLSGRWVFVESSNYCGWVAASNVVTAKERSLWQEYVEAKDFLIVTASAVTIGKNRYGMGAKLPLTKEELRPNRLALETPPPFTYLEQVKIPAKNVYGDLYFENVVVNMSQGDVSRGYLPYTRENIIRQSFKMLGEPYDWGGRKSWRDCSSLVQDIYRVFGIYLPRNADTQERSAGKTVNFAGGLAQRENLVRTLKPGATLHMGGHVVVYLGEYNQNHYAIHAVSGYNDANGARVSLKRVVVSDLSIQTRSGYNYLEILTVGKNFE